jgi:uncharacterized membrane protein (UPF0127 family)
MKNKKIILIVIILVIILAFFCFYFLKKPVENYSQVCIREKCVKVEIADNPDLRERGLMYRSNLCENCGMLFIFPSEGKYGFWMKNTKIPLDIIWIDKNKKIIDIISAEPCSSESCRTYYSSNPALYVLEVNSGYAAINGIKIGDEVEIRL